jgi:hypothetical protein
LKAIYYHLTFAFVQTKILLLAHDYYAFNYSSQLKSQNFSLQLGSQEGDEHSESWNIDFGFKPQDVIAAADLLDP